MNPVPYSVSPRVDPKSHRRLRAFTLVELLTVIAIIGILAAILVPTIGSIRAGARKSQCISNLRQVGTAYMMYMTENKNRLPNNTWTGANPRPAYNIGYIDMGQSLHMGAPAKNAHAPAEISPLALGSEFTALFQHATYKGYYRTTSYWPNIPVWSGTLYSTDIKTQNPEGKQSENTIEPTKAPMLGVVDHDFLRTMGTAGVYLQSFAPTRFEYYGGDTTPFFYFDGHVDSVQKADVPARWCPGF